MKIPFTSPPRWARPIAAGRFAGTVRTDSAEGCMVGLIGLADDTGVRMNGGRVGAARGPAAVRAALARYGAAEAGVGKWPRVFDAGDVVRGRSLDETHARVTAATAALLGRGLLPVAIGGGHDLTFPFVRAVAEKFGALTGVYFDAHLDVRETAGSGMAFRRLIETGAVARLELHGFGPLVNAAANRAWFEANGGTVVAEGGAVRLPQGRHLFASFDLDVLDAAHAPGVSATNPAGWTVREAEEWVRACGRDARVRCFDVMELNPRFDVDGRTARVAAHLLLTFLAGLAER